MSLSLDRLRILEVLLRTRSPTLAADELMITQSAASKALKHLRGEFADALLVRQGDIMVLTPRAERMLPSLGAALRVLQSLAPGHGGKQRPALVTLAMRDQFSSVLTAPLLRLLKMDGEDTALSIVPYDRERVAERLMDGTIDGAIAVEPPDLPNLMSSVLYRDEFLCLTPHEDPPSLEAFIAAQHVVTSSHAAFKGVDAVLATMGLKRRLAARLPYFTGAIDLAAEQGFFVTLPASLARKKAGRLHVHPLPFAMEGFAVSMVWDRRVNEDAGHRWLRGRIREAVKMR